MDKVYIISRYRANDNTQQELNKAVARHFSRMVVESGDVPVAPHLFYPQFLDDNNPIERDYGLELGIYELRNSDRFLLILIDGVISEGMKNELAEVSRLEMTGCIVSMTQEEIIEAMKVVK